MAPRPEFVGLNPDRWRQVDKLSRRLVAAGELPNVVAVARRLDADAAVPSPAVVHGLTSGKITVRSGSRFPVASLTKPVVAAVALRLCERGMLSLTDRVADWVPEFRGGRKRPVTVRHLLTHTSGLPDVWPDNTTLRQSQSTAAQFLAASAAVELLERPGQRTVYSSVGYSVLGGVLEAAGGADLGTLARREIFDRLAMADTALGGAADPREWLVPIEYPTDHEPADWDWNSRYWRELGAPWGGLVSTAGDMLRFLGAFAAGECVSPVSRDAAWTPHAEVFPEAEGRPWGMGWRFNWPGHASAFSDLLPSDAVGHYGATGCVMWHSRGRLAVILSSRPVLGRPRALQLVSAAVAAAFE